MNDSPPVLHVTAPLRIPMLARELLSHEECMLLNTAIVKLSSNPHLYRPQRILQMVVSHIVNAT